MKAKMAIVIAVTVAVVAGVCCALAVKNSRSVISTREHGVKASAKADEISVLSAEERKELLKKIAPGSGADGSSGSETHTIKYANQTLPLPLPYDVAMYAMYKAQLSGIDPDLVFCLIWRESNFDPNAICKNTNGTYDYGLMQINSSNYSFLSQKIGLTSMGDLLDPFLNIDCGIYFLSSYLKKYDNDYNKALMCYNLGENGAKRKWAQGIYSFAYSKSIIEKMGCYYIVKNEPIASTAAPKTKAAQSTGQPSTTAAEATAASNTRKTTTSRFTIKSKK